MSKVKKTRAKEIDDNRKEAHSQSIRKTLSEIEKLLEGTALNKAGSLRRQLRARIKKAFDEIGETWYRKGFNRGHRESYTIAKQEGRAPKKLKASKERQFTPSSTKKLIKLRSKIK